MNGIALILLEAMAFALLGVAVRIQHTLHRGFDLTVAVGVLVAAETLVAVARSLGAWSLLLATATACFVAAVLLASWNFALSKLRIDGAQSGMAVFVISLGLSGVVAGSVGFLRGPGLREVPVYTSPDHITRVGTLGFPTAYGLTICGIGLATIAVWSRQRTGYSLNLFGQDREFAEEVGLRRERLVLGGGAVAGFACGLAGCQQAMSGGSTPDVGMQLFLYGASSALLLPSPSYFAAAAGGAILGSALVLLQFLVSPNLAHLILFAGIAVLMVVRGTSRTVQGVR